MSKFVSRAWAVHMRGCRYAVLDEGLCWAVSEERARELLTTGKIHRYGEPYIHGQHFRRRACRICRPDLALRLVVIKVERFSLAGGYYVPETGDGG